MSQGYKTAANSPAVCDADFLYEHHVGHLQVWSATWDIVTVQTLKKEAVRTPEERVTALLMSLAVRCISETESIHVRRATLA